MRSIILIVLDCVRADHVSAYGYARPTTPTIDALAKHGTRWTHAYSPSSWTKPSVSSLLTGLYPSAHGVFKGVKSRRNDIDTKTDALMTSTPTLAEALTNAGWRCGAFLNNAQLGEYTNINRGFDTYVPNGGKVDKLLAQFEAWLKTESNRPTFAYLHFLEAHWPYRPRRRHMKQFGGDRDTNCYRDFSAKDYGKLRREMTKGGKVLSASELTDMVDMYDGAIRRLDGKIKLVRAMLDEVGMLDEATIVVTADHGEELNEHGSIGHGQDLSQVLTHVPLVISSPQHNMGNQISQPVSLAELTPTLLDIADVACPWSRGNLFQQSPPREPVCAELLVGRRYEQSLWDKEWKIVRSYQLTADEHENINSSPRATLLAQQSPESIKLFNLNIDPQGATNLADQTNAQPKLHEMIKKLDDWWSACTPQYDQNKPIQVTVNNDIVQRLRDLGYID